MLVGRLEAGVVVQSDNKDEHWEARILVKKEDLIKAYNHATVGTWADRI